jgi:flagellar hook-length control protein FliK
MTVQASKPLDPVKPPSATARTPSRHAQAAADSGFAQLLKGQTTKTPTATDAARQDEGAPTSTPDHAHPDKPRTEAKPADSGDPAAPPDRTQDPAADAVGQPAWWQALQAQHPAGENDSAGADALAALRDAAASHGRGARAALQADAATAPGTDKAGLAGKDAKAADPLARFDLADLGLAGQGAATDAGPAEQAAVPGDGSLPSLSGLVNLPASTSAHLGAPAASAAAASAEARLPMPPDHPAFPQALGVQLSTWLRDGVEHARLELHPQDLGPIDVRIAVTGGQTRVDLNADVAATRIALAQAIPQLAEVLGDVGLALSGSSVSAQTGQGGQGSTGSEGATAGPRTGGRSRSSLAGVAGGGDLAGDPGATRVVRHQGLLDLYA